MSHGEGREADDLNRITKGYLTEHEEDVADAQVRCDAITYLFWCDIIPEDFYPENKEITFRSDP